MSINERLIHTASDSTSGASGNQQERLIFHVDANDVDSYDGDGSVWYDITDHEYTPATDVSEHFNTVLYTGNGGTQAITGVGFQPDLVWVKQRTATANHLLFDSLRGVHKQLNPNQSYTETDRTSVDKGLDSFDSDGFTVKDTSAGDYEINGTNGGTYSGNGTYVAWCFKAGGAPTASTPFMVDGTGYATMYAAGFTDGTEALDSLSVNTKLGFSIAKWSGSTALTGDTVAHGLEETPELIIHKSTSLARDWNVYSKSVGLSKNLHLNQDHEARTNEYWTVNSNTFSIHDTSTSGDWIAYSFASKRGVSKVGSYTGTGTSGNKVYTGFQPAFVMIKNISSSSSNWMMYDVKRDTDGTLNEYLEANTADAEASASTASVTPNADGFTLGNSNSIHLNRSGHTFIYLAFAAEKPDSLTTSRDDFTEGTVTTGADLELKANDYSGSGNWLDTANDNDGTITGAVYNNDGNSDYFDFDGTDDKVDCGASVVKQNDMSVEMWINFDDLASTHGIFSNYSTTDGNKGFTIRLTTGGDVQVDGYGTGGVANRLYRLFNSNLSAGNWYHLVVIVEAGTISCYVDTVSQSQVNDSNLDKHNGTVQYTAATTTRIGESYAGSQYLDGKIAQVRVYDSILSSSEVKANYDATKGLYQYPDLKLHLDAASYSGSGYTWTADVGGDGTITGATYDQELGDWFNFDGSGDVVTSAGNITTTDRGFTVEAWVRPDSTSTSQNFFEVEDTSGNRRISMVVNTGSKFRCYIYEAASFNNSAVATSTTAFTTGKWYHIAVTFEQGVSAKMYVNGNLEHNVTSNVTANRPQTYGETNLGDGAFGDFNGGIGQYRFYSSVLTADQVMQNYRFTKNDYPNGNHATGVSSSSFNTGGYFNVPVGLNNIAFPFNFKKDQTLVWWVKHGTKTTADSASRYRYYMFDMKTATYSYWQARVDRHATNGYQFQLSWRQDSSNYIFATDVIDNLVNQDDWNMYACYFTGTEGMYYSVNGGDWNSGTATLDVGTSSTLPEGNFLLGKLWSNGSYYSNPNPYDISDIKVFDKVLSSDELSSEYSKGQFGNN